MYTAYSCHTLNLIRKRSQLVWCFTTVRTTASKGYKILTSRNLSANWHNLRLTDERLCNDLGVSAATIATVDKGGTVGPSAEIES